MIKSQKKAANSYNMEVINSYIMNWPLKRTVINPVVQIGGSPIFRRRRLRQPLIPQQAPPIPPRRRPVFRQRPTPKPRILSKRPTPAPRNNIPQPIRNIVPSFFDQIKDYYKPEVIAAFQEKLNDVKSQINPIKKLDKALNDYAVSAEINIFDRREPRNQFNRAYYWIERFLRDFLNKNRGLKFSLAIKIRFYKLKLDENGKEFREYIEGSFSNIDKPEVLTNSEEIKEKYDFIVDMI